MTRLQTILVLTTGYFLTIFFEVLFNNSTQSSFEKITLWEHIQQSFLFSPSINLFLLGFIIFILSIGFWKIFDHQGIITIYVTLLKFFELLPLLIDLINLLFIYQHRISHSYPHNLSNHLKLTFIFAFLRLIINLDIIHHKCNRRSQRQILVIFDILLFILINISLLRYTNKNLIRIGRKIILGLLIFKLNNLYANETFWVNFIKSTKPSTKSFERIRAVLTHCMLFIRWILASLIVCLFLFFTLLECSLLSLGISIIILFIIRWDTLHNYKALKQDGILRYCLDFDIQPTASPPIPIEPIYRTCLVCYDDKDLSDFDGLIPIDCRHQTRSVCNLCILQHVQKAIEITFTDDIYCPELECGMKFDYHTLRNILLFDGDDKLIERYDRYVFQRELEQMDEFIWCSNPLCNVGQLNEGGPMNNIVTCFSCHQKTCFTHKVKWHERINCEEYDQRIDPNDESSRRWIVENSKKCPQCPYQIEKNDGCDHMTCIKCRYEFCWSCLADFQPIRKDGNHRHEPTCKHYAFYDEEKN